MCTGITVTRRYVPHSRQTNKAGSKIDTLVVVTMEPLPVFLRSQGDFQKDCLFKDGQVIICGVDMKFDIS